MRTINKYRFFSIFQYDQEEEFLNEMGRKGYELVDISFIKYKFKETKDKDYVYKLDYIGNLKEDEIDEYKQLFKDNGWEYLLTLYEYAYFRKKSMEKEVNIFSDRESKLNMLQNILVKRVLFMLPFVALMIYVSVFYNKEIDQPFLEALRTFITSVGSIYLLTAIFLTYHFFRIKSKIKTGLL